MEKTIITIVCENRAMEKKGIMGEHGFCALIEKNNEKILLDTGQGLTLKANAQALNIHLPDIDKLVLSHGHFDHTGGLAHLMPRKKTMDIYAHPDIFAPKYRCPGPEDQQEVFIGTDLGREQLESEMKARFHFRREFSNISNGIYSCIFPVKSPEKLILNSGTNGFWSKKRPHFCQTPCTTMLPS